MPDARKAAVLLMSLPQDDAALILSKLEPKQVEAVSIEIARLGVVTGEEQESVIQDFAAANPPSLASGSGSLELAKTLVERALGTNAGRTLESVRQQIEALPFGFLQKVDNQNLLTFLMDEHPQTIALIVSHLKPAQAAEIIKGLPPDRQLGVIRRVATMGQTNPEMIREVEKGLQHRMSSVMSQQFEKAGGVETVAEILNISDRATERSLLENLAQETPELVEEIRRLMFVFEDITKLSNKDVQSLLKNVDKSQLAMALKGASESLKEKILSNMTSQASEVLKEEMEYLGAVKLSAVEQVQQQIVDIVRRLEDMGEISTSSGDEHEPMVT
jgi:flagellar motor switch protein FliG